MHPRLRFWLICLLGSLILLLVSYLLVEPTRRCTLLGLVRSESFYRGKPTNWWAWCIEDVEREHFGDVGDHPVLKRLVPRPGLTEWLRKLYKRLDGRRGSRAELIAPLEAGDVTALPVLIELMDHESEYVRVTSAQCMKKLGPAAAPATRVLARGLRDTGEVQEKSYQALFAIGPPAREAIPMLKSFLHQEPDLSKGPYNAKWEIIAAARILHRIDPDDPEVLPVLLRALNDADEPDERLRTDAIMGLGEIGPGARGAVRRIVEVIRTPDNGYQREEALKALKKIDPAAALGLDQP